MTSVSLRIDYGSWRIADAFLPPPKTSPGALPDLTWGPARPSDPLFEFNGWDLRRYRAWDINGDYQSLGVIIHRKILPSPEPITARTLLAIIPKSSLVYKLPVVNLLDAEHSGNDLLGAVLSPGGRFLEIGYGDRKGTLYAAERRGAIAQGLELRETYPDKIERNVVETGPVDVLFINGQNTIYYRGDRIEIPNIKKLLNHFQRARRVMIQSYDCRSPLEILQHAERQNGIRFRVLYYRARTGHESRPIFPSDYGNTAGAINTVLVAERM